VSPSDVNAQIQAIIIRRQAVSILGLMASLANDALESLIGLFRSLAAVSRGSTLAMVTWLLSTLVEVQRVQSVDGVKGTMGRQNVLALALSHLRGSQAVGVILLVLVSGPMDVVGTDARVVHRHDVSVVATNIPLLVLVRILKGLEVIHLATSFFAAGTVVALISVLIRSSVDARQLLRGFGVTIVVGVSLRIRTVHA